MPKPARYLLALMVAQRLRSLPRSTATSTLERKTCSTLRP